MEEVPLTTIHCGKCFKTQPGCSLSLDESSPMLDFHWNDIKAKDDEYVNFQCRDISAVDLRVEAKFGSIDAMKGTIIVECLSPVLVHAVGSSSGNTPAGESFVIEATFNVNETGAVRDIIRQLRKVCLSRRLYTKDEPDENGNVDAAELSGTKVTTFKEGLPDWVSFIPHYLYSKRARQSIELAISIYMMFSVMWALWQLYRHVDFVRESVKPLIDMLQYQYQLLDHMVQLFNTVFEEYTTQWLCFIKPLYTVATTLVSPLLRTLGQLSPLFHTVQQGLTAIWHFVLPITELVFSVGYQLLQFVCSTLSSLKTLLSRLWSPFFDVSVPAVVSTQFHSVRRFLRVMYNGLGQVHRLDPLKAQLIVMRTTVINSSKALGLGLVHLVKQIYKFIWLRRSARTAKEE